MMLIDTSAWIEFLRRVGDPDVTRRVATYLETGTAAVCGSIEFELLTGARPAEVEDVRTAISFCEQLEFTAACWRRAAKAERDLRGVGVTVPRDDVFVATIALEYGVPIYACDAHFELMQAKGKLGLQLV
ncbi:MAG: PIN domain-containing protein [Gemmatimonadetes bacterium]|jgi:predicted nucleic acid-binding protein|nr:PIN domain-containing protein [Gemmatimonadota bacterium]MBT6145143.1 PIN domain-containing protein [Gemmatimonadota bacterium]MBT7860267.1 PIN domain-containing protein [Gemmatimonadota bacterium]